jgi:mono/diheme cytochrome c family protein
MMLRMAKVAAALLALGGICAVLWTAVPGRAAVNPPPIEDAKQSIEQGLALTFTQDGKTDARPARLISLYVPASHAPTPFLKPGPFTATWTGFLNHRHRGEVTISVHGRGKVLVKIAGKTVLEAAGDDFAAKASPPVKLEKGKNPLQVIYTAPDKGDAQIRLLWSSREWLPEPVQPTVLSHDVSAKPLRQATRLRDGRELLANLRCIKCHEHPIPTVDVSRWNMPELEADAPSIEEAGARLQQPWMAAWIADPKALRPDATMPKAVHGKDGKLPQEAADLAAYFATLGKPAAVIELPEPTDESVAQGGQLFAALGCIGCHSKPDAEEIDRERNRVPLKFVNAKFQPGALKSWLLDPQKRYQWSRMPNFHLTDFEADRLVAYLTRNAKGELPASDVKGDAPTGQKLFVSLGCSNCHVTPALKTQSMQQLLTGSDWTKGCMAADEASRAKAPDFSLTPDQRSALQAIAAAGLTSLHNDVYPEFAQRSIKHLQCNACHARDEVEDRWTSLAEEVKDLMPPDINIEGDHGAEQAKQEGPRLFLPAHLGKLGGGDQIVISGDQSRPDLTWTGEKLRPEWSSQFIAGKTPYKPRYWLRARMPAFPRQAHFIGPGLAMEHGMPPRSPRPPAPKEDLAQIGQKLVGRDGGFACITCHSVNDSKAISPFEAPAPNLIHTKDRLTNDFYMLWMRKPMRFQPGTKMPQYSEDGQSTLRDILDGDADKQFDAIWNYILQGARMVPPE